jgi:hypothetical protein
MPLEQGRGSAVDFASPCVRVIARINQEAVGDRKLDRLMGAWRPSMVEQEIHLGESLVSGGFDQRRRKGNDDGGARYLGEGVRVIRWP